MKYLFTIVLLWAAFQASAEDLGSRLGPNYKVLSSEFSKKVKNGKCELSGKVLMFSSALPLTDCFIVQGDNKWDKAVDNDGYFKITVDTGQIVYFYSESLEGEMEINTEDIKNRHKVELEVYIGQKQPELMRKPVVYLYSSVPIQAKVKVEPKGEFTFTYPKYDDCWEVNISAENQLSIKGSERTYPYLFWEAESYELNYSFVNGKMSGFIVESDSAVSFLSDACSRIGLNATESTDLITYWGPILQEKNYAFIQFLVDEEYAEKIASIDIDPAPQTMCRVYLLCSLLDDSALGVDVVPQTFNKFERDGFIVVEWGGSIIDLNNLKP